MNKIIIVLILLFSFGCQTHESQNYIDIENEAISDVILEMTKYEEMKRVNELHNEKLTLYIISSLDTVTAWTQKPEGYTISSNSVDLSTEEVGQNRKDYEEKFARYAREEELFKKFKNGKIKKRNLDYPFKNDKLNIKLIEVEEIQNFDTKEHEFGYLTISRIVFNHDFAKGYLHYSFNCGNGCAWADNIEISKVNGEWKITEYFSGAIAYKNESTVGNNV